MQVLSVVQAAALFTGVSENDYSSEYSSDLDDVNLRPTKKAKKP